MRRAPANRGEPIAAAPSAAFHQCSAMAIPTGSRNAGIENYLFMLELPRQRSSKAGCRQRAAAPSSLNSKTRPEPALDERSVRPP